MLILLVKLPYSFLVPHRYMRSSSNSTHIFAYDILAKTTFNTSVVSNNRLLLIERDYHQAE